MQVILLEKVANLGNLGDVVKVRDGYARNFLIPQGKAKRVTPENLAEFETRRAELGLRIADGTLRGDTPGPPAAVKRISNPTFPLELTLSADDSMMGQPLPEKGSLTIHLDGDGNASTKEPGDLTAAVQAFSGTPVTIILENGAK